MTKRQNPSVQIQDAGALVMHLAMEADFNKSNPQAAASLRSAIYHLSIAQLWITCPEAMADAISSTLGRPHHPSVKLAVPPPNHNAALPSKDRIA